MGSKVKKPKINKLCARCSFDCTVTRAIAVELVPDSKRAEVLKNRFGDGKPTYSSENCPKKKKK